MANQKDTSAVDTVYNYLFQNIRSGIWKPGDKIPSEADLCNILNVSRVSVRSALGRLSALRLVQSKQGKGTFVSDPPAENQYSGLRLQTLDRLSLFEFRRIIERESAALAALRATSEDVLAMQDSIYKMEHGETEQEIAEQDLRFHALIAKASGNEVIQHVSRIAEDAYLRMFVENVAQLGSMGTAYHRQILLDIQVRDADAARQHMNAHLDEETLAALSEETPLMRIGAPDEVFELAHNVRNQ